MPQTLYRVSLNRFKTPVTIPRLRPGDTASHPSKILVHLLHSATDETHSGGPP
jgi:hypothetical protein